MGALPALARKESRQNAALFFAPALLLLLLYLARISRAVSGRYLELMAVALPVALAAAFGLQAFDAEENAQTRDFLLTKPVSPRRIAAAKYFTGLGALLLLFLAGEALLLPEAVRSPSFADYSTFWFYSYFFLALVVHGACFATAAYVKGPGKVLYGALFAALCAGWFFTGFFSLLALAYYLLGDPGPFLAWMAVLLGLAILAYLIRFLFSAANWSLRSLPFGRVRAALWRFAAGLLLIPLSLWAAASAARPAIRPFSSLFATFLGGEEWFVAASAVKQPEGDLYALADARGRLAVAAEGGRPRLVYAGGGKAEGKPLSSLAWSPDGRRIVFCEDGIIKVCETASRTVVPIIQGEIALWSTDPDRLLILRREPEGNAYRIYLADFTRRTAVLTGSFDLSGLALGWDADRGRLLILGPDRLLLFTLATRESKVLPLPSPLPAGSIVLGGRILPPGRAGRPYRLALFAASRRGRRFDVHLYDYDPLRERIAALPVLQGLACEELVLDPGGGKVLGRLGMGIYRILPAKEGSR